MRIIKLLFSIFLVFSLSSTASGYVIVCQHSKDCGEIFSVIKTAKESGDEEEFFNKLYRSIIQTGNYKIDKYLFTAVLIAPSHPLYNGKDIVWKIKIDQDKPVMTISSGFIDLQYHINSIFEKPTLINVSSPIADVKNSITNALASTKNKIAKDIESATTSSKINQLSLTSNNLILLIRYVTQKYIVDNPNILALIDSKASYNPYLFKMLTENDLMYLQKGRTGLESALFYAMPVSLIKIYDRDRKNKYSLQKIDDGHIYTFQIVAGDKFRITNSKEYNDHPFLNMLAVEMLLHYYNQPNGLKKFLNQLTAR